MANCFRKVLHVCARLLLAPPLLSSFKLSNYYIEMGIIALFAAYGVNYFVGRNKNREIVTRWCVAHVGHL